MQSLVTLLLAHSLILMIAIVISALPLYISIKLVGGEGGLIRIVMISIILSFASLGAARFIGLFAGIFMVIATVFVYMVAFRLSLIRVILVWLLQYLFVLLAVLVWLTAV